MRKASSVSIDVVPRYGRLVSLNRSRASRLPWHICRVGRQVKTDRGTSSENRPGRDRVSAIALPPPNMTVRTGAARAGTHLFQEVDAHDVRSLRVVRVDDEHAEDTPGRFEIDLAVRAERQARAVQQLVNHTLLGRPVQMPSMARNDKEERGRGREVCLCDFQRPRRADGQADEG